MTVSEDVYIRKLENEVDQLEKSFLMLQQTLAFILLEIGEPVTILHGTVAAGLPEGTQLFIDEDPITHDHTIGVTIEDVDNDA